MGKFNNFMQLNIDNILKYPQKTLLDIKQEIKRDIKYHDFHPSFEFFPPNTEQGNKKLMKILQKLKVFSPDFISVTYGAAAASQNKTFDIIDRIQNHHSDLVITPHLTCLGKTKSELEIILNDYYRKGLRTILALRGDYNSAMKGQKQDFTFASDFVSYIKKNWDFHIQVATYPEKHIESQSLQEDIDYLKLKFDNGAQEAVTQLFFNNNILYDFLEHLVAVNIQKEKIIPGVVIVNDFPKLINFTTKCGAQVPDWLMHIANYKDHISDKDILSELLTTVQCADLIDNDINNFHFFTLNQGLVLANILSTFRGMNNSEMFSEED